MKKTTILLAMFLIVGCQPGEPAISESKPEQPSSETANAPHTNNDVANSPVETATPQPEPKSPELGFVLSGPKEIVFDWTTDRCEPDNIPDIAARAIRDANGQFQLTIRIADWFSNFGLTRL